MPTGEFVKLGLTFVLGALIAILAEPLRRWLFRAKLDLEFKPEIGLGTGNLAVTTTGHPNLYSCYFRVLVKTRNRLLGVVAKSCRPFLIRIEREVSPGQYQTLHHDPLPVPWASLGIQARDIPPGIPFYFDFLETNSRDNLLTPQTGRQHTLWCRTLMQHALYRFTVGISGENVSLATLTITLHWQGQWNNFRVGTNQPTAEVTPQQVTSLLAAQPELENAARYPLRGTPVDYRDPTEPVAESEWETLE